MLQAGDPRKGKDQPGYKGDAMNERLFYHQQDELNHLLEELNKMCEPGVRAFLLLVGNVFFLYDASGEGSSRRKHVLESSRNLRCVWGGRRGGSEGVRGGAVLHHVGLIRQNLENKKSAS